MQYDNFSDVYLPQGGAPAVCYRSGLIVYEEFLDGGVLCSGGWNTAGYPLNVLSACPSRFSRGDFRRPCVFGITANGVRLDSGWLWEGCTVSSEEKTGRTARLLLKSTVLPVCLTVVTRLDGTGILSRQLEIENTGTAPLNISELSVMQGGAEITAVPTYIQNRESIYRLGYMQFDDFYGEGDFNWRTLPPDITSFEGRFGRPRHRYPMFMLQNSLTGTVFTGQLGWSAGYRFTFDLDMHEEKGAARLWFSADITGNAPVRIIAPGEIYRTPALETGMLQGDPDEAVNRMNSHLRRSVMPSRHAQSCLVGAGMGAEHDMSLETSKRFIDQMAYIGCEAFIVDAGWFCPPGEQMSRWYELNGGWIPDKDRYPGGIGELRDYCREKGMKFGLWMEPERPGTASAVYKEHPEWFTENFDSSRGALLDFTVPKAAQWAESECVRVIEQYGVDLFRVDYNIVTPELFTARRGAPGGTSAEHTEAVYAMYERLHKRFPDVIFENCASGGGRCDCGIMRYFDHTWVSDDQIPPMSRRITAGMTMALPPERVDRLVAGMGCHRLASLDYHMRNAILGHISMNVLSPKDAAFNPEQLDFIKHSIALYKSFIRPFLPECRIYHHTEQSRDYMHGRPSVLEIASKERDRAAVTVLTAPNGAADEIKIIPRGLSLSGNYEVTLDNTGDILRMSAAELARGITLRIPASLSSELILLRRL